MPNPLSPGTRVQLVAEIVSELEDADWDFAETRLVLFGLDPFLDRVEYQGEYRRELLRTLRNATDSCLVGLASNLRGEEPSETPDPETGSKPEHLRVFLSHLAVQKVMVSEVADGLAEYGIDAFVAHEAIHPSLEWQVEIERALNSADALVVLLHAGFSASSWTQQEVGWMLGRGRPVFMIRLGEDPTGFVGRQQAASVSDPVVTQVVSQVVSWLDGRVTPGRIAMALVASLAQAASYYEARDRALRLQSFGRLNDEQLDAVEQAYKANDQIYGSVIAGPVVARILSSHGR